MELDIIRRTRIVGTSRTYQQPILKLESPKGRFFLTRMASDLMALKANDGIMFGFNFGQKKCYIFKDDEIDSFRLREYKRESTLRFTSKDLLNHFDKCFDLKGTRFLFKITQSDDAFLVEPLDGI